MKKLILIIIFVLMLAYPAWAVNDVTGRTWVLDTEGSVRTSSCEIVWIIWTNIGTDADDLVIHDSSGGDLVVQVKGMAGIDMIIPFPGNSGQLPGFYLTTLDSGTVLVRIGSDE